MPELEELQRQIEEVRVMAEDALDRFPLRSTTTPGAARERHIHDLGKHPGGVIAARVFNSGNISIPNNTTTALTFDSERFDTDTIHSTSANTGRLTATTAGKYFINAAVSFASNATGRRLLRLIVNGSTVIAASQPDTQQNGAHVVTLSTLYDLAKSDYVEVDVLQVSGDALNVEAISNLSPEFMMSRVGAAGTSGGGAPGTDHGSLTGLGDDDHVLYLLAAGSRAGSTGGAQSFGSTGITTDVVAEDTGGAGVAIDTVLLKDDGVFAGGHSEFGNNEDGSPSAGTVVDVNETLSDASVSLFRGLNVKAVVTTAAAGWAGIRAMDFTAQNSFGTNMGASGVLVGVTGTAVQQGAGTVPLMAGSDFFVTSLVNAGAITDAFSIRLRAPVWNQFVVPTTVAGIEILDHGADDPTNSYAIRIVAQSTGGTTNQSLRVEGSADSVHAPNLRIGSTTPPTAVLDVTGAALFSSTVGVTGTSTLGVVNASGLITGTLGLTVSGADFSLDGDLDFVGAQSVTTSTGDLTLAPAGDTQVTGNMDISSHLAVGSSGVISTALTFSLIDAISGIGGSTSLDGIRCVPTFITLEPNNNREMAGLFFRSTVSHPNGENNWKTSTFGMLGEARYTLSQTGGALSDVIGGKFSVLNFGTVGSGSEHVGFTAGIQVVMNISSTRFDELYGVHIKTPTATGTRDDQSAALKIEAWNSIGSGGAEYTIHALGTADSVHVPDMAIGVDATPDATLDVDQTSTSGAQPVLKLDQADVDEDYFKFVGTSDTSADRALVDAADFTTPGAIAGWLKINIEDSQATNPITDGDYYIPFYAVPTA